LVIDTSAFIAGFDPSSIRDEVYTVPMVEEELSTNSMAILRFRMAVENEKMKVKTPSNECLDMVKGTSKTVGDMLFLSEVDMNVLALSLELKSMGYRPLIVTDDYSIQNVANQMGIEFASLITFGIRYKLHWTLYCPACYRKYPSDHKSKLCNVCGNVLKRKSLRKTLIK